MKRKNIFILITLFLLVGLCAVIKSNFINKDKAKSVSQATNSFIISDSENKIEMVLPDSFVKSKNETVLADIPSVSANYISKDTTTKQITILVMKMPSGTNDTALKKVLSNYFFNIAGEIDWKAGKLKGIKYKSYICGVPVENFLGVSGDKIYHYAETLESDSMAGSHLKDLNITQEGRDIKSLLTKISVSHLSSGNQTAPFKNAAEDLKRSGKTSLISKALELEDLNSIRIDIPNKIFRTNPDTTIYFVKQHYYAREHTFQKSIACNFVGGTSVEYISYPSITFVISMYESPKSNKPYQTIQKTYQGNEKRI